MNRISYFKDTLFQPRRWGFEERALELFNFQAVHNEVYAQYLSNLKVDVSSVQTLEQIPCLPIEAFKSNRVITGSEPVEMSFTSSGTTGANTSHHYIRSEKFYLDLTEKLFSEAYGEVSEYAWLALLPAYLERKGSSLVSMANRFIDKSKYVESGFFLDNLEQLNEVLGQLQEKNIPTVLLGVSFGLLDFAEQFPQKLEQVIVMETGGMKGRRKEMVRDELHQILKDGLGVKEIHSEYGMTELMSQSYSKGRGVYQPSSTMKILIRDTTDPFAYLPTGKTGGINVIDLGNVDSCAFISTQDLGLVYADGSFEVLGRFDHSDIRGCNLMVL